MIKRNHGSVKIETRVWIVLSKTFIELTEYLHLFIVIILATTIINCKAISMMYIEKSKNYALPVEKGEIMQSVTQVDSKKYNTNIPQLLRKLNYQTLFV